MRISLNSFVRPSPSAASIFRLFAASCVIVAGLAAFGAPVLAQDRSVTGPPRGITPGQNTGDRDNTSKESSTRTLGNRPGMQDGGIQIGTLSTISDVTVGLLTEETGGFAATMWDGSDRRAIESLIGKLPAGSLSPVVNDLTRRVLLTTAAVPQGLTRGTPFVELRLERLLAAGHASDALALIDKLPALARSLNVISLQADALMLNGQVTDACALAAQIEEGKDLPYFLRLRAACFVLNEEAAAAELTAGLFKEQGGEDPLFFGLITSLTSGVEFDAGTPTDVDPIHLILLERLGEGLPSPLMSVASPGVLAFVAQSENFDIATRLEAAEKAEAVGLLPTSNLSALYDLAPFTEDQKTSPLSSASELSPALANALLYQSIKTSTAPSASAEIVATAMFQARMQSRYTTAARIYWPVVRGLEPSSAYLGIAEDMSRMAVLAGAVDRAIAWYELLRQSSDALPTVAADLKILLLAAAQSERLTWTPLEAEKWLNDLAFDEDSLARKVRELTLLQILGFDLNDGAEIALLEAPAQLQSLVGSPAILQRLNQVLPGSRLGEALTLALTAIGSQSPAEMHTATLRDIHLALTARGLRQEARALIFDAVLLGQVSNS